MWDLIVSVSNHCLSFYLLSLKMISNHFPHEMPHSLQALIQRINYKVCPSSAH